MIEFILKIFLIPVMVVLGVAFFIFCMGLYLIFKVIFKRSHNSCQTQFMCSAEPYKDFNMDLKAIAGDDFFATQLDLARAFIEADKQNEADKILANILKQGSINQQIEAKTLRGLIKHLV